MNIIERKQLIAEILNLIGDTIFDVVKYQDLDADTQQLLIILSDRIKAKAIIQ